MFLDWYLLDVYGVEFRKTENLENENALLL